MAGCPARGLSLVVALASTVAAGCGGAAPPDKQETAHLRSIVSLYNFASSQNGRPPANEQQFKEFVAKNGSAVMERFNIRNPDDLFISERDGQPFVIVYEPRPKGLSRDVIAYEQTGVDGKREVGMSLGMIQEVDEGRFRELVPISATPN